MGEPRAVGLTGVGSEYREVERPFVNDRQIQDDARSVGMVFPPCPLFSYLTFLSDLHEAR